ncbi:MULTISPECIES: ParB N-terminal domain-containing protein [unclassified Microbacterium]|uniref:ParB N-terminal domain-containing protein n=1 Tax=unclassified Microbacterium TaxID=2609290 RepID=UPI000EA8D4EA|nr:MULTISPECIES: ParB N-terminal domain-containing protein [unclassified Microbacterium]MBT2483117.1 ParB N-terminal domain-containing protein [Microbacterium sp. ISL-108]RKN66176.1 chromosome partitioning protein ParB [Microbacterium sp. CGR2]
MSAPAGHIELERTVASISVGHRHRTAFGDIDELAASIDRDGLLQPITITPDGVLVCGARRLAAIKQLGWRTVNVWVRSGISDRLGHLLAEQDDNVLHKPLTQTEAAALYRELKTLMAEDAARRQASARFSAENQPGSDGGAKFAPPSTGAPGKSREQAAAMVPGGASHTTLEKIGYLQRLADDPAQPADLRKQVSEELERIDAGAPVHPIYEAIRATASAAQEHREADLHQLATEALARAKGARSKRRPPRPLPVTGDGGEPVRYPVRAFVLTWGELANWWSHYDARLLVAELTDEQIESFLTTAEGTSRFAEELRAAHDQASRDGLGSARGHLRAL